MNKLLFTKKALQDCEFWLKNDRKILEKIYKLFKHITKYPYNGLGKPEALKGEQSFFSKQIDEKNRLVYKVEDKFIKIIQCKNHYEDK